ncbi:MAG: hypothetical protein HY608_04735 [Planctomycetes bacterium]|nr:hypothetical protein [Planctomycetota bacterium]
MKLLAVAIMLVGLGAMGLYGYTRHLESTRYELQPTTHPSIVHKIDRRTGEVTIIRGGREETVSPQPPANPGAEAIGLVQHSSFRLLFSTTGTPHPLGDPDAITVDSFIAKEMRGLRGDLLVVGWRAERWPTDDPTSQTFLVSHVYQHAGKEHGYYFEVLLDANIVRLVNGDADLTRKYGRVR